MSAASLDSSRRQRKRRRIALLADERKPQLVDAARVEHGMADDAPLELAELQLRRAARCDRGG